MSRNGTDAARDKETGFVDRRALAQILGVSVSTVDRGVQEKLIPSFMVGSQRRFDLRDVVVALKSLKGGRINYSALEEKVLELSYNRFGCAFERAHLVSGDLPSGKSVVLTTCCPRCNGLGAVAFHVSSSLDSEEPIRSRQHCECDGLLPK